MARRLKLLIAAPNWLGDLLMATSLLEIFAQGERQLSVPCPEIHLSIRDLWRPLLADDPRLVGLVSYARRGRHGGWGGAWRQGRDWRRGVYPAVLLLPPSLRAAVVSRLSGIPTRIGFRGDARAPLLSDPVTRPARGTQHYTEELGELYRVWARTCAGCEVPPYRPAPLPRLAASDAVVPSDAPPLWLLSVGTTYGDAKTWPADRQADLVETLLTRGDVRVVLVGDAAARGAADGVTARVAHDWQDRLGSRPGAYDLVGRTALAEVAALLRGAAAFVGNDSGLMHLAAAVGTPTVGIYGSSSTVWTRPRGALTTSVRAEGFPCQPCFLPVCDRDSFCLDSIDGRRVARAADALIEPTTAGPACHREPPRDEPDTPPAPVLFVDRDGVIIEDTEYISDPAEVRLLPGAAAALARAAAAGVRVVIVTNQSGIGRGFYSEDDFAAVQTRVDDLLSETGVRVDGVYYCPHGPDAACNCRKPRPGMLDAVGRRLRWHSRRAWMVGDKLSDLDLGRHFGLETYLVRTGRGREAAAGLAPARGVTVVDDLARAVDRILGEMAS